MLGWVLKTLFLEEPSAVWQSSSQLDILLTHQNPVDASELNVDISYKEVKAAVLSAEIIKLQEQITWNQLSSSRMTAFSFCIKFCFKYSITPTPWSKGIIQPIPKGNNGSQNLSYVVLKAYSKILNQRWNCWLEENNLLANDKMVLVRAGAPRTTFSPLLQWLNLGKPVGSLPLQLLWIFEKPLIQSYKITCGKG